MSDTSRIESRGLCRTCNNEPVCVYRAKRGYDALYCDMFDSYVKPGNGGNGHQDASVASVVTPSELKGLCANCDHKDSCALPKPEGGVWHCEEYC